MTPPMTPPETQGLTTASAGPKAQAVKVTLRPNEDLPLV